MSRKVKISFLILIWGLVAIQSFINWNGANKERIVDAFSPLEDRGGENCVKGYAYLGTDSLSEKQKEEIIQKLAMELKITVDSPIVKSKKKEYLQWSLNSEQDNSLLQLVSLVENHDENSQVPDSDRNKEENYLFVEIKNVNRQSGKALYNKLHTIFDDMGVSANVNLERTFSKNGNLQKDKKARDEVIKNIFINEQIQIVDEIDTADFYTVYGIQNKDCYITNLNGKKVNRQIVFSYSEEENITYVKLGYPIVNSVY